MIPIPAAILPTAANENPASEEVRAATPKPYFMIDDDSPAAPPRVLRQRRDRTGRPQTRGLPAGIHPGSVAEAASQSLAESPEHGLTLRTPPKWYRLISRSGAYRGPSLLNELGYSLGNFPFVATVSFLLALTLSVGAADLPQAMQQSGYAPALVVSSALVFLVVAVHAVSFSIRAFKSPSEIPAARLTSIQFSRQSPALPGSSRSWLGPPSQVSERFCTGCTSAWPSPSTG